MDLKQEVAHHYASFRALRYKCTHLGVYSTQHNSVNDTYRFPLADVLWTFAMAMDTYLVVFYHFDAHSLHKLEIKYIGAITTLTFIPALVFLFVQTPEKGPIYGSETVSIPQNGISQFGSKLTCRLISTDLVFNICELDAYPSNSLLYTCLVRAASGTCINSVVLTPAHIL